MKKIILILFLVQLSFGQDKFFTYYPTWCMGTDAQWTLQGNQYLSTKTFVSILENITHVIVFHRDDNVDTLTSPYFTLSSDYIGNGGSSDDSINYWWNGVANPQAGEAAWASRGGITHLRDSLHAKGKYILLEVQDVAATAANGVLTDSAKTEVFTDAIAQVCYENSFDGVDYNMEMADSNPLKRFTASDLGRFFRKLRQKMPDKIITAVPVVTHTERYAEAEQYLDFILPQMYAYSVNDQPTCGSNGNFLIAPLYNSPIPAGSNHQSLKTWGANLWSAAGWAKSKIVILLSNEANPFPHVDTMFSCDAVKTFWADTVAEYMTLHGGTYTWDAVHIGGYISGTADEEVASNARGRIHVGDKFYIAVLSDENIDSVYTYFKSEGYNNYGLYDVSTDARTPNGAGKKMPRHSYLSGLLDMNTNKYLLWKR